MSRVFIQLSKHISMYRPSFQFVEPLHGHLHLLTSHDARMDDKFHLRNLY